MRPDDNAPDTRPRPRILLAEDSPSIQQLVCALLADCGYDVDVVDNGDLAVTAMRSGSYDLVLMDIEMPVMGGLSAAAAIRRLPGRASATPILALTANTDAGYWGACRDVGMNDLLPKPIRREPLLGRVKRWLARAAERRMRDRHFGPDTISAV